MSPRGKMLYIACNIASNGALACNIAFNAAMLVGYANYLEHNHVKRNVSCASAIPRYEKFRHKHFDRGLFLPMEILTAPGRNMAYEKIRQGEASKFNTLEI